MSCYFQVLTNEVVQTKEDVSGRSKPPSVHCGIQLSAIPGRTPGRPIALFWLAPAGVRRFIVSCPLTLSGLLARITPGFLAIAGSTASSLGTGRIVSVPLP